MNWISDLFASLKTKTGAIVSAYALQGPIVDVLHNGANTTVSGLLHSLSLRDILTGFAGLYLRAAIAKMAPKK